MSLLRTRRSWLMLAALAFTVAAFWPMFVTVIHTIPFPHRPGTWLGLLPILAYGGVVAGLEQIYKRTWKTREGAIRTDEHGLYVDGVRIVKRGSLRHGHIVKEGERMFLRLHRRAPFAAPYEIEVANETEGRKLLTNLRFDALTSVSEFEMRGATEARDRRYVRLIGALIVGSFLVFAAAMNRSLLPGSALFVWWIGMWGGLIAIIHRVTRIAVGADGLRLNPVIGSKRFIAFSDIRDVRLEGKDLHLDLVDGTSLALHRDAEGATVAERIREALANYRVRTASAATVVNRGDRTTEEWIKDATTMRERGVSYRHAAVPDDELWNIVEDAAASPTERAGAALALRGELDDHGRTRLRVAAGACAEKKLRVALESVAKDADDDALVEVLEPLEDRRAKKLRSGTG